MLKQSNQQIIEDLLESDDELPTEYNEDPDIPAYQNDKRFDTLRFSWIDTDFSKYYEKHDERKMFLSSLYSSFNEDVVYKKTENLRMGEKSMVFNGVLNQEDIFCLKSLEPVASDATLLWFINFLMYKDLQSNFSFLKTCLVDTIFNNNSNSVIKSNCESKKYNFDIVIKSR